jgi:hypothetical protein
MGRLGQEMLEAALKAIRSTAGLRLQPVAPTRKRGAGEAGKAGDKLAKRFAKARIRGPRGY